MKTYAYSGPVTTINLVGSATTLIPGDLLSLPETHPKVQRLVALGHLAETGLKPVSTNQFNS